jgi:hypothetical protein
VKPSVLDDDGGFAIAATHARHGWVPGGSEAFGRRLEMRGSGKLEVHQIGGH